MVLEPGTPVLGPDGSPLGEVARVDADIERDIFDGIEVRTPAGQHFVEAARVAEIREHGVTLEFSADEVATLPAERN